MHTLSDPAAERAVLSGICRFGSDAFADVDDLLSEDTFTIDSNQNIYSCFSHIFKTDSKAHIDLSSILSAANSLGLERLFKTKAETEHLKAIIATPVKLENLRRFAGKIRKLEMARMYYHRCGDIQNSLLQITGDEPADQIISLVENPVFDLGVSLSDSRQDDLVLMGDGGDEYLQHLLNNPRQHVGIPTGFKHYDLVIGGGLRRAGCYFIGARPKIGKSSIGDAVSLYITRTYGIPVLNLDTEMTKEQHQARIWASLSGVSVDKIESGSVSEIEKQKVITAQSILKKLPYNYACVKGKNFDEILSIARRWIVKYVGFEDNGRTKDCVLVYDYLKLMSPEQITNNMAEHQAIGFQVTKLNDFVGKYDIPCLSFVQLNRDGIEKESSDVIALSDRVAWFCAGLSIFKEKDSEEITEDGGIKSGNRKIVPLLHRFGAGLDYGNYINLQFEKHINRITELNTKFNLQKGIVGATNGFETTEKGEVSF